MIDKEKVKDLIDFLNYNIPRLVNNEANEINFTGTSITPDILNDTLDYLGYWLDRDESNGWYHDCWFYYNNHPIYPPITMFFCGFQFTLKLYLTEPEDLKEEK